MRRWSNRSSEEHTVIVEVGVQEGHNPVSLWSIKGGYCDNLGPLQHKEHVRSELHSTMSLSYVIHVCRCYRFVVNTIMLKGSCACVSQLMRMSMAADATCMRANAKLVT